MLRQREVTLPRIKIVKEFQNVLFNSSSLGTCLCSFTAMGISKVYKK